jgi:hypothetical protein
VNVIDENMVFSQRQRLTELKIRYKQIGFEIGRLGMKDRNDVIPLLHRLRDVTFFTRDQDYYHPALRHSAYCLVHLEVPPDQWIEIVESVVTLLARLMLQARLEPHKRLL